MKEKIKYILLIILILLSINFYFDTKIKILEIENRLILQEQLLLSQQKAIKSQQKLLMKYKE